MESNQTLTGSVRKSAKNAIIFGILVAIVGIVAIVYPEVFGKVSVSFIGIFMITAGVFRSIFAIASYSWGSLFMRYLYGFLLIAGGIWVVSNPDMGLEALTLVMAIYFLIDGLTELFYAFSLMPMGGGFYLLIGGLISVGLAVLIFTGYPESSDYFIGIYLGVKLLIDGLTLAFTGGAIRKNSKDLEEMLETEESSTF